MFAWRAKHLYRALSDLVTGTVMADDGRSRLLIQALYEHPLTFWFDLLSRALRRRGTGSKISAATGRVERTGAEVTP